MALPRVAIVGRPNVGKSSIMNMLARAKVSIVDPTPGVTRDRVSTVVELAGPLKTEQPRLAEVIDTGGYGVYTAEGRRFDDAGEDLSRLTGDIERQIATAVASADVILLVVDAQAGVTALDQTVAELLRRAPRAGGGPSRVQVVANKVDAESWEAHAVDASALGFGEPWLVGAKNNYKRRDFSERLFGVLPETPRAELEAAPEMRLALVGRRNAGKSTFVNALAGEERVIVSEIAGTTRDAVDVRFTLGGRSMLAIDTAGVRKRTKFSEAVEHYALLRMQQSVQRADVVLLCIDATADISGLDKRLGRTVADEHKPCIVVVTKWDLAEGRKGRTGKPVNAEDYLKYIQRELPGLSFAPIVFSSATDMVGLEQVIEVAFDLFDQARERVATGELNKVFREILEERGPSSKLGTRAKILYVSQVSTLPPTIVLVVNKPELFSDEYKRYLMNRIRERLPFAEVPVRLLLRARQRADLDDLLSGEHRRTKELERASRGGAGGGRPMIEGVDPELVDEVLAEERAEQRRAGRDTPDG